MAQELQLENHGFYHNKYSTKDDIPQEKYDVEISEIRTPVHRPRVGRVAAGVHGWSGRR
jgi:hypothetical protein